MQNFHCCSIRRLYNIMYLWYMYNLHCIDNDTIVFLYFSQNGDSLLHLACANGKVDVISYILHTGKLNPIARNHHQKTPLEEVQLHDQNRFKILKMLEPFEKCRQDYPVDSSYRKVIFLRKHVSWKEFICPIH